jgi:hypothetical protein
MRSAATSALTQFYDLLIEAHPVMLVPQRLTPALLIPPSRPHFHAQ